MNRYLHVHVPNWPVRATGGDIVRERVGARELVRDANAAARSEGVRVGMRRREAEACCPDAQIVAVDHAAEARRFEPIVRGLEALTPRVVLDEPGRVAFPTRGPARYFGGDGALVAHVREAIGLADVHVGVADGAFCARLAARADTIVAPGDAAAFLAPFTVRAFGDPDFAALLERLGLTTLGAFAALPAQSVHERFGVTGTRRHRLARGDDPAVPELSVPPEELAVGMELDPPADRVDAVAFAAKALADRLVEELAARVLAVTVVTVEAQTEHGEDHARTWRHEDGFSAGALVQRVRWQLEGWITTSGVTNVRLVPEEVVEIPARQLGFFGGDAAAAARADRVLARVQGMLGYGEVGTLVEQGGRTPVERIRFVPWGEPRVPERPLRVGNETAAWPGALPAPFPARVFDPPLPAMLVDADDEPVRVSARGEASSAPVAVECDVVAGRVRAWAGPWPADVRWWDARARRRGARWQLVVETDDCGDCACVVAVSRGRAVVEALYD